MATTNVIKMQIQFRRDTWANWELHKDIVPAAGEPCFVTDKNILKIGDGKTSFEKLEAIGEVKIDADGESLVFEDGVFKLAGFDAAAVGAQPRKTADGKLEWVVPSTKDVDDLKSDVGILKTDVSGLKLDVATLKSDSTTLLGKIESLESKVGAVDGTVDDRIDAKINEFANKISADGTVNTLKELVDYVAEHGGEVESIVSNIANLQKLVGNDPVQDQIAMAIANSGHMSKEEAQATLLSKVEAKKTLEHVKYEVSHKPVGTLVDYRDKEIRVMVPANHKWEKQNVGATGNANMYYMGFKAYAPEGAVSFKEGDRGVIVDEMFDFNGDFAGTDEFGRNYSICWLALASYDAKKDAWTYYGANSTVNKYIGWTYCVEWYDANGVVIGSDSIRINLSNEACHNNIEPYYMNTFVKEVAVNGTIMDLVNGRIDITVPEIKESDEIAVAEDGTLSIKKISFDKIEQGDVTIVMDGGSAV